jgi:hypothetical protein
LEVPHMFRGIHDKNLRKIDCAIYHKLVGSST